MFLIHTIYMYVYNTLYLILEKLDYEIKVIHYMPQKEVFFFSFLKVTLVSNELEFSRVTLLFTLSLVVTPAGYRRW